MSPSQKPAHKPQQPHTNQISTTGHPSKTSQPTQTYLIPQLNHHTTPQTTNKTHLPSWTCQAPPQAIRNTTSRITSAQSQTTQTKHQSAKIVAKGHQLAQPLPTHQNRAQELPNDKHNSQPIQLSY